MVIQQPGPQQPISIWYKTAVWLYDFVSNMVVWRLCIYIYLYIAIQEYTIDFRKPCTTTDISGFICLHFLSGVRGASFLSFGRERPFANSKEKNSKFIDLTVWLKHQEIRNSQRIGFFKLYIFFVREPVKHTLSDKKHFGESWESCSCINTCVFCWSHRNSMQTISTSNNQCNLKSTDLLTCILFRHMIPSSAVPLRSMTS